MLALCLMLLVTYYALNYAGIIGLGLGILHLTLAIVRTYVRACAVYLLIIIIKR